MLKNCVKGCYDRYPKPKELWQDPFLWQQIDKIVRKLTSLYGFEEVVTPSFEYTEIFTRSSGEESDIVSKEMYTFLDKKGRSLSLRPELTAPVIRAYIENGGMEERLSKLYYLGSCYRYNRAQRGRYRQFNQFGIEVIGEKNPFIDIEVISMLDHFFKLLGLSKTTLLINSIGSKLCREVYSKELVNYFSTFKDQLSDDSKRRLTTNPLRILDSKESQDIALLKGAPNILDYLNSDAKAHFNAVLAGLDRLGISYKVDPLLVRGLDYYTDTVFEVVRDDHGFSQNSLGGGGVYAGLVKDLGGKDLPGIGFGVGIERVIQYLLESGVPFQEKEPLMCYFIGLTDECKKMQTTFAFEARHKSLSSECHYDSSIKSGLKKASEKKARYAIILGEEEIKLGVCKIKDLYTREEESLELTSFSSWLSKISLQHLSCNLN
jgi:histidyl-tRNA synthetase